MAGKTLCSVCSTTQVRFANELCGACKRKASEATPAELASLDSEAARPGVVIGEQLRQTAVMQGRVREVMDAPQNLLCVACGLEPAIVERVPTEWVLDQHVKQSKVIGPIVGAYVAMKKRDEDGPVTADEEEELFTQWFHRRSASAQKRILAKCEELHKEYGHLKAIES